MIVAYCLKVREPVLLFAVCKSEKGDDKGLSRKKGRGGRALFSYGPELTHFTVKLVPSAESAEGDALVAPPLVTIVIWCMFAVLKDPMGPVVPLMVA